ncbi:MAG: biotin/lipoyl-binding protein [Eubacteriales bacterium]|nr:biotin/lipoyl-binding protein [Eubacteriales bacterium]
MRKFLVNVNGTQYQIEVEEMDKAQVAAPSAAPAPKAAPTPAAAPVAAPAAAPAAAKGAGQSVNSPMPGNILSVAVNVGDAVKAGQVLMMLEAMKMENEILAPADGVVTGVAVVKGATVSAGQLLCTIA